MQTVLITGISKGIGFALAEKFLAEGFFVIGTAHQELVSLKNSQNLLTFELDLSSGESIASCAHQIVDTGKKIDILINNAGVLLDEEETKVIIEKLRETLKINLIGTIDFIERIIPIINSAGHILNISSTAGSLALTGRDASHFPGHYPAYKISKAALNMYTCTLAKRLQEKNIRVVSVHPGWVKTQMGGDDADIAPEEAARDIFKIAISDKGTGQFLHKEQRLEW